MNNLHQNCQELLAKAQIGHCSKTSHKDYYYTNLLGLGYRVKHSKHYCFYAKSYCPTCAKENHTALTTCLHWSTTYSNKQHATDYSPEDFFRGLVPLTWCGTFTQQQTTDSRKHRPSWDANSHSVSQEITLHFTQRELSLLCSQEHTTSPCPERDQSSPYPSIPSLLKVHSFPILPHKPRSPKQPCLLGLPNKTSDRLLTAFMHATCPTQSILLELITLIILGEEQTSCHFILPRPN